MDNTAVAPLTSPRTISRDTSMAAAQVPVIDFAPFLAGTPAGKRAVAAQIRDACEGTGFFYLAGHGVPQAAIDAVFAASRRFFALPLDERMKVRLQVGPNRGYQPL